MRTIFRDPQVEEAPRNIILQNRCGNRLTLLFHEDRTDLEFVYKPNAFRRKEYRARNFSNRDNFTALFPEFRLPQTPVADVKEFGYDPFVTRLATLAPSGARNRIAVVNVADENLFAIAARAPLALAFRPHARFDAANGLLTERFTDRGEEIVSFVAFEGFEENRYRVLDDGTHVLQILESEVVLIGGEENPCQVDRVVRHLRGLSLDALVARNEELLALPMSKGRLTVRSEELQRVLDVNARVVYSGIDEGGACFGAINRIYHLIWVRDGAMTTALMARAGNPDYLRLWAPFLLANPSVTRREDGRRVPEFLQIVGSRWTKSEDDGIFYALLTLFAHFVTTGDDGLLRGLSFGMLLEAIDRFLEKAWEADRNLIGSDTRGEESLASSPYFGYDAVDGSVIRTRSDTVVGGRLLKRCHTLYYNVNTYNVLLMANVLLGQRAELDGGRSQRYGAIAELIQESLQTQFATPEGELYSDIADFTDGTTEKMPFGLGCDYWEHSWAVSLGPFFPVPELQLRSARRVQATWASYRGYGFCPWNILARTLREHGLPTAQYSEMLAEEVADALALTNKYPMPGALTEYQKAPEGWRGLPFSAGSLFFSVASNLVQSLPLGIAVRAGELVDSIENFRFRLAAIEARVTGAGEAVGTWTLNGTAVEGTLQVPEGLLRSGTNRIEVKRSASAPGLRLRSSSAALLEVTATARKIHYEFSSVVPTQLVFECFDGAASLRATNAKGKTLAHETRPLDDTGLTLVTLQPGGDFAVVVTLK